MKQRTEIEEARKRLLQSFTKLSPLRGATFSADVAKANVEALLISTRLDTLNWVLGERSILGEYLAEPEENGRRDTHATSNR